MMKPFVPLTTILALLASAATMLALATPLQACSSTSITPCGCPDGTEYAQSVTFATIGAKATDVRALIGDFFSTAWYGSVPFATQGSSYHPGALRSSSSNAPGGTSNLTEKLTGYCSDFHGSFIQQFERQASSTSLQFSSSNGSTAGFWVTLQSSYIFEYETDIRWKVYACTTGHPFDYAQFHEESLTNATKILQDQGKVLGTNLAPVSIQSF